MRNRTTELVNGIAGWIEYQRTQSFTRIPEGAIQLTAEKIILTTSGRSEISDLGCYKRSWSTSQCKGLFIPDQCW